MVTAHWPEAGVNIYVWVPTTAVFIVAGLQVPVMPFVDVAGRTGALVF